MSKLYTKNTWTDEVLASDERYNIAEDDGTPINSDVQINLATSVVTAGTSLTADRMNNIEKGIDDLDNILNNAGLTEKLTPSSGDRLLLYDHENEGNPKSVDVASLGAGQPEGFSVIFGDGENPITTGVKGYVEVKRGMTIQSVRLAANASGSIVINIWQDTFANFPPTVDDTITGSTPPTLSNAQTSEDITLTNWTATLTKGNVLAFNVSSVDDSLTLVTLSVQGVRT